MFYHLLFPHRLQRSTDHRQHYISYLCLKFKSISTKSQVSWECFQMIFVICRQNYQFGHKNSFLINSKNRFNAPIQCNNNKICSLFFHQIITLSCISFHAEMSDQCVSIANLTANDLSISPTMIVNISINLLLSTIIQFALFGTHFIFTPFIICAARFFSQLKMGK